MRTINPEQQFLEMKLSHWTVFEQINLFGAGAGLHAIQRPMLSQKFAMFLLPPVVLLKAPQPAKGDLPSGL